MKGAAAGSMALPGEWPGLGTGPHALNKKASLLEEGGTAKP